MSYLHVYILNGCTFYMSSLHFVYTFVFCCIFFISPLLLLLAFALSAYISILKSLVGLLPSVAVVFHSFS